MQTNSDYSGCSIWKALLPGRHRPRFSGSRDVQRNSSTMAASPGWLVQTEVRSAAVLLLASAWAPVSALLSAQLLGLTLESALAWQLMSGSLVLFALLLLSHR